MDEKLILNEGKIIQKYFNEYKIQLITYLDSIKISIQNNSNIYQSSFNFEYLHKLFIVNNTIESISHLILTLIEHNNIEIEENNVNMKLILISSLINNTNIELILNKTFEISQLKLIKSINVNNFVYSISIFPSGNIISVSSDQSIKIFDINYNLIQNITNAHNNCIIYVDVKDENNFVTCSWDKNIKTWIKNKNRFIINKIIKNAHKDGINKVIYYLNENLISCSHDNTIKIWEKIKNNYQLITILNHSYWVFSILLLKNKNILISSGLDGTKLWNLNNFELIYYLDEVKCYSWNGLSEIDNDRIIIGSSDSLKIISLLEKKVIKEINIGLKCPGIRTIKKKEIFLVGGWSKDLMIYKSEDYKCIHTIKLAHNNCIKGFIELKNDLIASYSGDGIIKIWSF